MENYNKIKNIVTENNCTLLTSFEEFELTRKNVVQQSYNYVRINFIGICGHDSSAVVINYTTRKTGIRCKDCTKKSTQHHNRNKLKETNETETSSIVILEKYLSNNYNIIRTKEGCKADIVLSQKEDTNKYIPIQVKSTGKISHKMYSFRGISRGYDNMLIVCVCIENERLWVIPYADIKHLANINISERSKYNKYLVNKNELLYDSIEKYAEQYYTNNLTELTVPISIYQQREQQYVQKREKYLSFLQFMYPDIHNTPTDFMVNGKKVQEKVAGRLKDTIVPSMMVHLSSNNGKNAKGKKNFRTYSLGENDYYWFHSNIDDRFWIIPEQILHDRGYIADKDEIKNRKVLYISDNTEWIKQYEYDYNNVNCDKIRKMFY